MTRTAPPVRPSGDPSERDRHSPAFHLGTLTTVTLAHDYLCPWCWVGFLQAQKLTREFGLSFDWRGAELVPPEMEYTPRPPQPRDPDAPPPPPSRFDRFAENEGMAPPLPRPPFARTHAALLGAEWALLDSGGGYAAQMAYHEAVYRGYWEERQDIADVDVLARIADGAGLDGAALAAAVAEERHAGNILPFDDEAYAIGIRHVPTFIFGAEERLAEAEYAALALAAERFLLRAERWKDK